MIRFWICMVLYFVTDFAAVGATAKWLRGDGFGWALASLYLYTICTAVWLVGMGGQGAPDLARAASIYSAFWVIPALVVAFVWTGEHFTARDWVGVALGIASCLVMNAGRSKPEEPKKP